MWPRATEYLVVLWTSASPPDEGTAEMPQLTITLTEGQPDQVTIAGEIDLATAPQIDAVLARLTGDVAVDCAGVGFIDSAGFHALDRGHEAARQRGAVFAVAGLSNFATRIAELLSIPYLAAPGGERARHPRLVRGAQLVSG